MSTSTHQKQLASEDRNDRENAKRLHDLATDFAASLEDAAQTIRDCLKTPGMESPTMASSLAWIVHLAGWNVQKIVESTQEQLLHIGPNHP